MIGNQRDVETQREPLAGEQEQKVEEDVQDVFRKNELEVASHYFQLSAGLS